MKITPVPSNLEFDTISTDTQSNTPTSYPLISCIMPTTGRAGFVAQSVEMFLEQDYPNKELLIVYNKDTDVPKISFPPSVRLIRCSAKITGAKRNEACRQAYGAIITHWDDDDIFNTDRLMKQSAPIREGVADVSGLSNFMFYELGKGFAWLAAPALFRSLFTFGVATGSIMFSRAVWEQLATYPNLNIGEDTGFMSKIMKKGAIVKAVDGIDIFVYVRHGANTWFFNAANYSSHPGWKKVPVPHWAVQGSPKNSKNAEPAMAAATDPVAIPYRQWRQHRNVWALAPAFAPGGTYKVRDILYTSKRKVTNPGSPKMPADYPLISCVMPTAGRAKFIAQSIHYFLLQDYPNKELIIVYNKDGDLPDIQFPPSVKLVRAATKILGGKRNEGNRHAKGSIIAQWDDDDLYNTQRLTKQAMPIINGEAHITGLNGFAFYELFADQSYLPTEQLFNAAFQGTVAGGTLVYARYIWEQVSQYPNMPYSEDFYFLQRLLKKKAVLKSIEGFNLFVYLRHDVNTWRFEKDNFRKYKGWQPIAFPLWADRHKDFYTHITAPPLSAGATKAWHTPLHLKKQLLTKFLNEPAPPAPLPVITPLNTGSCVPA